ncbi:hypothetical protein D3C85_1857270 [compost metagenome]
MLIDAAHEQLWKTLRGLGNRRIGQAVMPVEHLCRIVREQIEHDVVTMRMQHVES